MQINDRMEQLNKAIPQPYIAVTSGPTGNSEATAEIPESEKITAKRDIICEHFLDVYVNKQLTFRLTCTAEHLVELILGRLFSEGWIRGVCDVESITICESGRSARVFLQEDLRSEDSRTASGREATCCTGNRTFLERNGRKELTRLPQAAWQEEWIFALAEEFAKDSGLHRQTGGTHSCYLGTEGKCLCHMEDIGRHNALDKCIGYALRENLDLKKCILFTTGRVPTDMVQKVIAAGIPVLASKAVPTDQAVQLAEKYHLTLICRAWPDRMEIYHDGRVCEK